MVMSIIGKGGILSEVTLPEKLLRSNKPLKNNKPSGLLIQDQHSCFSTGWKCLGQVLKDLRVYTIEVD